MKPRFLHAVVPVVVLLALALGLAACGSDSSGSATQVATSSPQATQAAFATGDTVAAVWTDGNYYLATVTQAGDGQVTVKYVDDGSAGTVSAAEVKAIPARSFVIGDRVLAVWSSGRFYPGEITAVDGQSYTVKWDDGSKPSTVDVTKIIAE